MWDKMKNAGSKTKLRGEIALLERECKQRKQQFGIELYDLLVSSDTNMIIKTPALFHANEEQIRVPFESCKADVDSMSATQSAHQHEIDLIQARREGATPAFTTQEKLNRAGQWMSSQGTEGKLQAQVALLTRQVRQRKERFGVEVFDMIGVLPSQQQSAGGGFKTGMSNTFSKFSQKEQSIGDVVEKAQKDVAKIKRNIQSKEDQVISLGDGR